ncbi:uncharacterized protein TRIVIDRAFT_228891 [Trichoderma virens Gv29-8]|jgi:hypothetical protein|uniref:Uncharacterized protein n=1 Tax=Hypocrea virens (strain Gv29-8 / FGSC 10586) TaxID=413071 RepID=G9NDV3_HYPVG|nr:uncharacterized protein TRIVIDRAFT_228891 [Trichoderma virens Gv29-8]EHK15202.1 hypothetical protein TRIVIDRAFT_228891 [Trichoderma virens Gv29-8]UKZ58041.1 hypothetical protein TrVGV298_011903 [Trichoderma virens]UKZ83740.1 hypothetical protein TrVFT333_011550 [Trichoderma virens FT-333]
MSEHGKYSSSSCDPAAAEKADMSSLVQEWLVQIRGPQQARDRAGVDLDGEKSGEMNKRQEGIKRGHHVLGSRLGLGGKDEEQRQYLPGFSLDIREYNVMEMQQENLEVA